MARKDSSYACRECGATTAKWSGQCGDCGAWNTIEEVAVPTGGPRASSRAARGGWTGGRAQTLRLGDVPAERLPRTSTGLSEFDRALGGGFVPGSVILIGGDPGIGKSTLLLQTLAALPASQTLYVTGEESVAQIRLRAERLGLSVDDLRVSTETEVESISATAAELRPRLLVIDSIQTLSSAALSSAPGSVAQLRESTAELVRLAKQHDITVVLIGHVTKEGQLAGPRVLEHMVDAVLAFEGDHGGRYRMLRAAKNRFGPVHELGVFAMLETGLKPVANPSAIFLSRHGGPAPGSVILVTREGTRPMLVEVQALVAACAGGPPRRITLGLENARLVMLLAVLARHGDLALFDQDVFANVVGGVRVQETAADLAVLAAVISSYRNRAIDAQTCCFGEIGLAGEIRPVPAGEERILEAYKHGFRRVIAPAGNRIRRTPSDLELIGVERLSDALDALNAMT
ncbi:MAG: DNA repair protein RadA [Thioalkalivibrionaceae bacterium]